MAEAWVYIDESQAPSAEGTEAGQPFRVGALLVEAAIPGSVPATGMATLKADPDAQGNKFDQETLARGYFHASLDSANAHSALSYAITGHPIDGAFSDMQWHFGRPDSSKHEGGALHAMMVLLGSLTVTQDDYEAVHLVVAKREGTFDDANVAGWQDYWRSRCLGAFAQQPNIPTRFPRMTITLVGGDEPGIQVCDLVLWAVQRAKLDSLKATGKADWMKRLGVKAWAAGGPEGGAQQETSLTLGMGAERNFLPAFGGGVPRLPEDMTSVEILDVLREIEAEVLRVARLAKGHPRVGHLEPELCQAATLLAGQPGLEDIVKVAETFLLVCDTLPTYDPTDATGYVRVMERRRVAAAVVDRSQIRWHTMSLFWRDSR
jgi:hypothetical protein